VPPYEPHPRAEAWPPIYATILELWRLARPAFEELAAERSIPLSLHDYAELGLETLSIAEFQRRDPYSRPEGFAAELARLEVDGWIELLEGSGDPTTSRYTVLPRARDEVRRLGEAGDARLGTLAPLPDEDLARLRDLLAAVAAANLEAPEPPERWATVRRFRTASEQTPLLGQIRERALDVFAYRDDAHIEAWRPHADPPTEGGRWNAFTHVWSGDARSAGAIARAAAFRGYDAAFYGETLAALEARGWLASDGGVYRTTAEGQSLRDAVERQTDDWFYAPWAVLGDSGVEEVRDIVLRLLGALRREP
jgi:DNA-binding MarR family transcriptional regulator